MTRPDIPHGSTATNLPDGAMHRTVLPWFVGVQADNLTLKNPAKGTWRELLYAHVEQTQPQQTPLGFTTQHFPVPESFPVTVQLYPLSRNLNDLSDAGYEEAEATPRIPTIIILIQSRL